MSIMGFWHLQFLNSQASGPSGRYPNSSGSHDAVWGVPSIMGVDAGGFSVVAIDRAPNNHINIRIPIWYRMVCYIYIQNYNYSIV